MGILSLERVTCADLDPHDPFFSSLRADYSNFAGWLARAGTQGRQVLRVRRGDVTASLAIVKTEAGHPTGRPGPGTKISALKVEGPFRGLGLGRQVLTAVVADAVAAGHQWVCVTVFDRHLELVELLTAHGFTADGFTPAGERIWTLALRGPGSPADGRAALMSIHPGYADALMEGTKRVELRKRSLAPDITRVVVYATAPVSRVVGSFTVTGQDAGPPADIWERHHHHAGIERAAYDAYFGNGPRAVAIRAAFPARLATPVPVAATGRGRPPQSFAYLTADQVQLLDLM